MKNNSIFEIRGTNQAKMAQNVWAKSIVRFVFQWVNFGLIYNMDFENEIFFKSSVLRFIFLSKKKHFLKNFKKIHRKSHEIRVRTTSEHRAALDPSNQVTTTSIKPEARISSVTTPSNPTVE